MYINFLLYVIHITNNSPAIYQYLASILPVFYIKHILCLVKF